MGIERITPDHGLWTLSCAHLTQHNMAQYVVEDAMLQPAVYLLASVDAEDQIVGHIALKMQRLMVPETAWSAGREHALTGPDVRPLREMFVQSFAVNAEQRRQGHGRDLQLAALDLTQRLGCFQLRSWSSLDKHANYALKLSLGFAAHPAIQTAANGTPISGVYFVKAV